MSWTLIRAERHLSFKAFSAVVEDEGHPANVSFLKRGH